MTDVGVIVTRLLETRDLTALVALDDYLRERHTDPDRRRQAVLLRDAVRGWWARTAAVGGGGAAGAPADAVWTTVRAWDAFARRLRVVFHFDLVDFPATVGDLRAVVPTPAQTAAYRTRVAFLLPVRRHTPATAAELEAARRAGLAAGDQ